MSDEKTFCCSMDTCDLTEDIINSYDQTEYMEILELLEEHDIDSNLTENYSQAQNLLFEHILLREKAQTGSGFTGESLRTNIIQNVVEEHHTRRKSLLKTGRQIAELIKKLPSNRKRELNRYFPTLDADIDRALKELANETCSFIVAGETGSGKSCFINLLMGHTDQDFLPVSNCPSTSCLCSISYGERGHVRAYKSGSHKPDVKEALDQFNMTERLSKYTHQKERRDEHIKFTKVEVDWPLEWLKSGLTIVDSPGVGERKEITEMVKEMMPKAFGFIYVINTKNAGGIQDGELEDLLFRQGNVGKSKGSSHSAEVEQKSLSDEFDPRCAIFVFNKWDQVDNHERQKIKDFAEKKLKKIYKGIDTESQMFFMSTKQATEALREKHYMTEEYKRVLKGIEKLMEFSLQSKMRKYYNYFVEVLSRLAFILKAYIGNLGDFQNKYKEIKYQLENLEHASATIKKKMKEALQMEVEGIVGQLKTHLLNDDVQLRLCKWHENDCPKGVTNWVMLSREANVKSHERVINEIKRWERENDILEKANERLLRVFQSEFMSLKDNLSQVENDLLGNDIDDKQLKRALGDINHSLLDGDDSQFNIKEKVILGITAPLWIPVGLVVGILAAPFLLGFAFKGALEERRKERDHYEGHLMSGTVPVLMGIETEAALKEITSGDGLMTVIESCMQDFVKRILVLMNKIPDFIKADKALLSNLKAEAEEGIKPSTQKQCNQLKDQVAKFQGELDYFYLLYVHENDLKDEDLSLGERVASGSFGYVTQGTWKGKDVAVKKMKVYLSSSNASEIKREHVNLRKIQSENAVKYYGLCMKKKTKDSEVKLVPLMVMELCDTHLGEVMYDSFVYTGPGSLSPEDAKRKEAMATMANFAMQIANGLHALHKLDMAHRDLKPSNILMTTSSQSGHKDYILKLCDFGLTKQDDILTSVCGTPLYVAPEVLEGKGYNKSSDLYGYGLILVELFYGKDLCELEFVEVSMHPTTFLGDPYLINPPSDQAKMFMLSCLEKFPQMRPTALQCYDFFKDMKDI